jgi:DNA polymerase-3 subunit alpha
MVMFTHLHTHSYYSLLAGIPSPAQLVERAASYGMQALALTDHNRLTGVIEFYDACVQNGIKPIIGLEVGIRLPMRASPEGANFVLLAQDMAGWGSLCRLSSILQESENGDLETLPLDILLEDTRGLLCLSGGLKSPLTSLILSGQVEGAVGLLELLKEGFPERLYVELQANQPQDHNLVISLAALAKRVDLPVVAACSSYYMDPREAHLQKVLTAIRLNCSLDEVPESMLAPENAYLCSTEEMRQRFIDIPAALEATQGIVDRCSVELPLGQHHFPHIDLPAGLTPIQALRREAQAGAEHLYGELSPEISERLEHELQVIEESGYTSLFLIMQEIINFTRQADIPYTSRGSAASSLVAHCLGITSPDPIRLNLYFERFLNPARHSPPDIDTDLSSKHRDQVIEHVYERYGQDRVAMVGTINRFRPRSALREVAKAYGFSQKAISGLIAHLPNRGWGPPQRKKENDTSSFAALESQSGFDQIGQIARDSQAILDMPDHMSIHPGGVVITPGPLHEMVPTQLASKGIRIIQFDLEQVERLGLVKIDLLATRGLSVLGDVADAARKAQGDGKGRLEFLASIPEVDQQTTELLREGRTTGVFGIESPGMQRTLKEIQASSIDDVMITLALYRPGPMTGGLKDAFVNRHLGREAVSDLHPALSDLLAETHGVILYQEQVLRIAHELAGFSLADADLLRRAMSHFDPGEQMKTLKQKFIQGSLERKDVPEDVGEKIWDMMAAFAGYGFPKAHAASYAQVSWKSAFCKVHYPAQFMAAVLANWGGYYRQDVYLLEARRMGLTLRGPHVNHSQRQFSVVRLDGQQVLFMGLDQVSELTARTQRRIVQQGPFQTLEDFIQRVSPRPKESDHLVRVGALEGLGSIPDLLQKLKRGAGATAQMELFPLETQPGRPPPEWSLAKKAAAQRELLGVSVIAHPLELVADQIAALEAVPIAQAHDRALVGKILRVSGLCRRWRRVQRRSGGNVYHTVLDDLTGGIRLIAVQETYDRQREVLNSRKPLVVEGMVNFELQAQETVIVVHRVWVVG